MRFAVAPINTTDTNPFEGDLLNKAPFAEQLSKFAKSIDDILVVALDAQSGEGKTNFVKMWQAHLRKEGIKSIYFDAFANDYLPDPFVAIAAELNSFFEKEFSTDAKKKKMVADFKDVASKVGGTVLSIGAKLALKTATINILTREDLKRFKEDIADRGGPPWLDRLAS